MNDFKILLQAVLDANSINQSDINKIQKVIEKYHLNLTADLDKASIIAEIKKIVPQLEAELQKITGVDIKINDDALIKAFNQIEKQADKLAEKVNKIQLSIDDKSYEAEIARLTNGFKVLSGDIVEAKTHTEALNKAYQTMVDATDDTTRLQAEKAYQLELSKTKNLLTIAQSEAKEYVDAFQVTKLRNDIQDWLKKNTAATKEARIAMESYLDDLSDVAHVSQSTFKKVKSGMDDLDTSMRKVGRLGNSITETFKQGAKSFLQWTISSASVMEVIQGLRHMYQSVYDIDTAMTNLYKVTDETDARYNKFLTSASKNAKELGRSVSSLVEQTANWSKLGYSLDESEELAKISSIYANVAEVSDDTAVSDLVTAMKAFNIEAKDAITIADRLNALGNKYATNAADLGTGLANSASSLALAGNSIDETLAMITAMTEITQDASESGNALKILSMRLRGMKGELEALGEESEGLESISKIQTQILNLTKGKVNIFDDNGNFKSTYEIMQGIADEWKNISQTDQAQLLEIIAGKQRGNSVSALLTNMAQANNALNTSLESTGSAYEEQERWMQSLEAKTQQFEAAFQSLSKTILNSDLVKGIVDFGTTTISILDATIDKIGTLGTIGLGAGLFAGVKNVDYLKMPVCPHHI